MSRREMERLGWEELDVLLVSGDAYVDHPSFGVAMLGRWLVAHGYRTGIVAQPRWTGTDDLTVMGRPRLFAGATAGAIDSMLAHYTAFRKKRSDDAYTPGGRAGARPNRACVVYANLLKQAFGRLPIVLGGIEASLRRTSHYDFWTDKLRRTILLDAKADLILYGMAERGIVELARHVDVAQNSEPRPEGSGPGQVAHASNHAGTALEVRKNFSHISGAVYIVSAADAPTDENVVRLPSHEEIAADPRKLMAATLAMEQHVHSADAFAVQGVEGRTLVLTPPRPLEGAELDDLYSLPFTRRAHPSYKERIPAAEMIETSITTHRGCGGGCSFCTLAAHQGRRIRSRSAGSILAEARAMALRKSFSGSISDVGGPSANMWGAECASRAACHRESCLFPSICPHFHVDQMQIVDLLRQVLAVPGVGHVRVASGIRHDLALSQPAYIRDIVREFVGGQLKIAPST